MLQSRTFVDRVLRNSGFTQRVISLVVDEAHCISHWGADFRKMYGTLGDLRAFLARGTPVVALSATLTPRVRRDIHTKLRFVKSDSRLVDLGNDRPNVSLVVRACQNPMNTYSDLDFAIPEKIKAAEELPKSWIYTESIDIGDEIVEYLFHLLEARLCGASQSGPVVVDRGVIRPFNARMSPECRREAMDAFSLGIIRIMICTEAAGLVSKYT